MLLVLLLARHCFTVYMELKKEVFLRQIGYCWSWLLVQTLSPYCWSLGKWIYVCIGNCMFMSNAAMSPRSISLRAQWSILISIYSTCETEYIISSRPCLRSKVQHWLSASPGIWSNNITERLFITAWLLSIKKWIRIKFYTLAWAVELLQRKPDAYQILDVFMEDEVVKGCML